jgi:uncharacterized protein (TIGR02271 family)
MFPYDNCPLKFWMIGRCDSKFNCIFLNYFVYGMFSININQILNQSIMSQTVIGIFEHADQAQEARTYLLANGFESSNVDLSSGQSHLSGMEPTEDEGTGNKVSGFFKNLFDDDDESASHIHAASNGTTVTVHTRTDHESQQAAQILDNFGALDVNEAYERQRSASTGDTTGSISVIQEDLQVGKKEVETGGVRLRSRIVARPVEETVRLREEHVNIERTPVDRIATEADFAAFQEGTIEVTEHAEIPVVAKEARIVEEVSVDKQVSEREEVIRDTVRHTEVDTENIDSDDARLRSGTTTDPSTGTNV